MRTVAIPHSADDWDPEAIPHRKFGVLGTIIAHHDSHGLCYDVKHEDGTVGCYDSRELVVRVGGGDVQVGEILEIIAQWGWGRHEDDCPRDGSLCRHSRANIAFTEVQNALYEEIRKRRIVETHRMEHR